MKQSAQSKIKPNLPDFDVFPSQINEKLWGNISFKELHNNINDIYNQMVHFRRNIFSIPSGKFQSFEASNRGQWLYLIGVIKYFAQEPIQRRFDFSGVLYFGWPNQPSSGTMRVYIGLLLCTYI